MMEPEELYAALEQLGPSWQSVYAALYAKDCQGARRNMVECPVARYLRKHVAGEAFEVRVEMETVAIGERNEHGHFVADVACSVPEPVKECIFRFDAGGLRLLNESREPAIR